MRSIIETVSTYRGFRYVVLMTSQAHRCGYVAVPEGHKFFGKHYDDLYEIDCHGGLTYSGSGNHNDVYPTLQFDTCWWFGFDCAHGGDRPDTGGYKRLFKQPTDPRRHWCSASGHVWTFVEVQDECKRIIDQVIGLN